MTDRFDAAVIGAGPAGNAAAITLARAGKRVALVEAKPFPRVKVCGEFVSPAASSFLEALITPDQLRDVGARRVDRFVLERNDRTISHRMTRPAWVLSRRTLDEAMVERAREAGVAVHQPATIRAVDHNDDHVSLTLATKHASSTTLHADIAIHADGSGRFAPRDGATPKRPGVLGLKCHIAPPAPHRIEGIRMRACDGAYVGTVAVEHRDATVALVACTELVNRFQRSAGPVRDAGGDALLASLWPAYDPAWRTSPWLTSGVAGSRYRPARHPRAFLAGNAAAAVEPVGGEGIGLALFAGTTLARLLTQHATPWTTAHLARVQRTYAGHYRRRLRSRRPACRLAAAVLERPRLVDAAWPLLAAPLAGPSIINAWYRLSGKPPRAQRAARPAHAG